MVNWDIIPVSAVRAIEVVRGGSSALYGDAAVGGVINIQTAGVTVPTRWRIAAGNHGIVVGSAAWSGAVRRRTASLYGGRRRSTGYRAHERGDASTLGGSIELHRSASRFVRLSGLYHDSDYDDPGPLPGILLADFRRTSLPYFRFDHHEPDGTPLRNPIIEYADSAQPGGIGVTVIEGNVYRGNNIKSLKRVYVFGDFSRRFFPPDGTLRCEGRGARPVANP